MGRTLERGTDNRSVRRAAGRAGLTEAERRALCRWVGSLAQPVVVVAVALGGGFGRAPAASPPGASSHSGVGCGGWMSTVGRSVARSLGISIGMSRFSVPAFSKENVIGMDWPYGTSWVKLVTTTLVPVSELRSARY